MSHTIFSLKNLHYYPWRPTSPLVLNIQIHPDKNNEHFLPQEKIYSLYFSHHVPVILCFFYLKIDLGSFKISLLKLLRRRQGIKYDILNHIKTVCCVLEGN